MKLTKSLRWLIPLALVGGCGTDTESSIEPPSTPERGNLDPGRLAEIRAHEPERVAQLTAELERDLRGHGVAPTARVALEGASTDDRGYTHARYSIWFHDREVIGRTRTEHLDPDGAVTPYAHAPIDEPPDVEPKIDEAGALVIAFGGGTVPAGATARLVYLAGTGTKPFTLAWLVDAPGDDLREVEVDAATGAVVRSSFRGNQVVLHLGHSQFSGDVSLATETVAGGLYYRMCDQTRAIGIGNCTMAMLDASCNGNTVPYSKLNDVWGNGMQLDVNTALCADAATTTGETAAVDAHFGTMVAWDMWKYVFGLDGPTGDRAYVRVVVHDDLRNGPYAVGNELHFSDTLPSFTTKTLTEPDVVGHEFGHLVAQPHGLANVPACDASIGGGVCESFADIAGTLTEFYLRGHGYATHATTLPATGGDWTLIDLDPLAHYRRYLDVPSNDGCNRNYAGIDLPANCDADDSHNRVGPLDRAFYYLSQGVPPLSADPLDPHASTVLPGGLAGLGLHQAAQLLYSALSWYEWGSSPYDDWRTAMLKAAFIKYGEYSLPYKAVQDAYAAVAIGEPADRTPPTITARVSHTVSSATISVSVKDASGLVFPIKLYYDGVLVLSSSSPSFSYVHSLARAMPNSRHVFHVEATDAAHNTGSSDFAFVYDNTPPTVSIATTQTGRILTATATATDAVGVKAVELWFDATRTVTYTAPPYTVSWDTTLWAPGNHTITAKAYDTSNNVGTASKTVARDTAPPVLTVTQQQSGDYSILTGTAVDSPCGVQLPIDVSVDGVPGPGPTTTTFVVSVPALPVGPHEAVFTARDACGNSGQTIVDFTKVWTPPTVTVTSIDNSHKKQPVFTLVVDDADGIDRVEAYIDGNRVAQHAAGGPYNLTIDTSSLADGHHQVHFVAYDIYGVPGDAYGDVEADNTGPTGIFVGSGPEQGPINFTVQQQADAHGIAKVEYYLGLVVNPLHDVCNSPNTSCTVAWSPCGNVACTIGESTEEFCAELTDTWGNLRDYCMLCDFASPSTSQTTCTPVP
ncbi:MAG TPA: Ig-like domain-containing protein [Kofleriaceae bacterium]|nr:Ig-like domain-containing protein [Kofleriaceae bacterium]